MLCLVARSTAIAARGGGCFELPDLVEGLTIGDSCNAWLVEERKTTRGEGVDGEVKIKPVPFTMGDGLVAFCFEIVFEEAAAAIFEFVGV